MSRGKKRYCMRSQKEMSLPRFCPCGTPKSCKPYISFPREGVASKARHWRAHPLLNTSWRTACCSRRIVARRQHRLAPMCCSHRRARIALRHILPKHILRREINSRPEKCRHRQQPISRPDARLSHLRDIMAAILPIVACGALGA